MNVATRFYRFIRYDMCLFSEYDKNFYKKYAEEEVLNANSITIPFALLIILTTPKLFTQLNWYLYGADIAYSNAKVRYYEMFLDNERLFNSIFKPHYKGGQLFYSFMIWALFVVIYSFLMYLLSRRANVKVSEGLAEGRSMGAPLYVHNGNIIVDNHGYIVSPVVVGDNTNLLVSTGDLNRSSLQESLAAVSEFVASSGNAEAQQLWDSFNEEINGKGRKSVLKSTWNGLVNILPDVATLAEAAAEIGKIFI